jgi:uncharacterized protein
VIILLHSSKTMRPPAESFIATGTPALMDRVSVLGAYLKTLSPAAIEKCMAVSPKLAASTHDLLDSWSDQPDHARPAIDAFLGDIYSGLQVGDWTEADRLYAGEHLHILSGLYGILRPLDGIYPYRLEMGYRLPDKRFNNLYHYLGDSIAATLPDNEAIINLAAFEYSKTVTPFVEASRMITPSFLTRSPKTGEPTFVVVHAKIARGAFANWLIKERIDSIDRLSYYNDLGYRFDKALSSPTAPVFVCEQFGGLGLSVRLT